MHPRNYNHRNLPLQRLLARYESQFRLERDLYFEEKAYLQIIEFYEQDCQMSKALEASERALVHHPSSAELHLRKAQLLLQLEREGEALPCIQQAQALAPMMLEAKLLYAEALVGLGDLPEASQLLEYLKEEATSAQLSDVFLIEALIHEKNGAHENRFYTLKSAVNADLSNEEALERLGTCIIQTKKFQEGVDLHETLLDRDPYLATAWYNLAQARTYLGDYEAAVEAYEFAFAIEENFWQAMHDCADLCVELKQYHRALKHYLDLLEAYGAESEAELYAQIGRCYLYLDRPQAGVTYFLQAARLDPMNDELFFRIGECYASQAYWANAVQYFEKALEVEQDCDQYYAALAEAYFHQQENELAVEHMKQALELNNMEAQYWILLATFLMDDGRDEEALAMLEEGGEAVPGTEVLYCRIACLFATGRRQEACRWLAEALTEDFDMHHSMFHLLPELEYDPDVQSLISIYTI